MHISIIVSLVAFLLVLACTCFYLYQKMRQNGRFIDAPESAVLILSHWCAKVPKGSDLDRLHYELKIGVAVLEKRKSGNSTIIV